MDCGTLDSSHAVYPIAHTLAGKNTNVGITITVSVAIRLRSGVVTCLWCGDTARRRKS